uniref:Thioredoxin domain-containing protein n=1 Tax=Globisporangium ultimum (strain ATCC 200006 / CBS 805.95 / DAOM BR144) TaxID=431595 RepID=K3X080_GLOUD
METRDRRHGPSHAYAAHGGSGGPWKFLLGAIGLLYVLFLVRVNTWTGHEAETRANVVGGHGDAVGNSRIVHAKNAAVIHREVKEKNAKSMQQDRPQLRAVADETPAVAQTKATMNDATTEPPLAYLDAIKSTLTSMPEMEHTVAPATVVSKSADAKQAPPKDAEPSVEQPAVEEEEFVVEMAGDDEEEEKAAHDHEDANAVHEEAPIRLAVVKTMLAPSPAAAQPAEPVSKQPTFEDRHEIIAGYEQTKEYLQNYKKENGENLFLFFTCSDDDGNPHDWSMNCMEARKKVYDLFEKSPGTNRLVTIRAGSEEYWEYRNDFSNDRDLRVKTVPCIMKWEGKNGETTGMMIGTSLLNEPFLRYLFKNTDKPDQYLKPDAKHNKHIVTLTGREEYDAYMSAYERETNRPPLYLFFVSGRIEGNNRPWCPYCRFSEIPTEYSFYSFAPAGTRLVRIEVTKTYNQWKKPNSFNQDPVLGLKGVPALFRILPAENSDGLVYHRIIDRFDLMETWRGIYEGRIN